MHTRTSHVRIAALGAALALLMGTRPVARAEETKHAPCCFTNARYSGVCQVDPSEGESCAGILAYLNNAASTGKSYCSSTDVRGGWAATKCK